MSNPPTPNVWMWQAAPEGVELPANVRQAVRIHRRGQDAVEIARKLGYQPGDTIGCIVHADGDQLPDVLSSKARIDTARADKLAAYVPLLEWAVDQVLALHEAGYVIDVVAADYENWLSPWAYGRAAGTWKGGDPDFYFGRWRDHREAVQQAMHEDQELMHYRIRRSFVLPLRAAGLDCPILNYGMARRAPNAKDSNGWLLPSMTLDGVSNPVLYDADTLTNLRKLAEAGQAIPWIGMAAEPETIDLGDAMGVETWLWFNHGSDAAKHREMAEAFAATEPGRAE